MEISLVKKKKKEKKNGQQWFVVLHVLQLVVGSIFQRDIYTFIIEYVTEIYFFAF